MLCDSCGKREATTKIKQSFNGETRQVKLCAQCANSMILSNIFSDLGMASLKAQTNLGVTCPHCGATLQEISKYGRLGCADCYQTFEKQLEKSIVKMHGKANHVGKVPHRAKDTIQRKNQLVEYKMQLNRMIAEQEFEQAAKLRDLIKGLEGKSDE